MTNPVKVHCSENLDLGGSVSLSQKQTKKQNKQEQQKQLTQFLPYPSLTQYDSIAVLQDLVFPSTSVACTQASVQNAVSNSCLKIYL